MSIFQAVILGIIEGVTEFLPISSTFHLILGSNLLLLHQTEFVKLFEVFIQSGAILSVVFLYYKILVMERELVKKVIVSFIPTAIIGFALHEIVKSVFFESQALMMQAFIGMGVVFLIAELLVKQKVLHIGRDVEQLSYIQAILVGIAQAVAIVPGVSRAGAVIVAMMLMGYRREDSARYSFLLAVPTIFAASALDLVKSREVLMNNSQHMLILLIGFVVSFVTSYIVIKWFIRYLQSHTLIPFALYRFFIGILFLI